MPDAPELIGGFSKGAKGVQHAVHEIRTFNHPIKIEQCERGYGLPKRVAMTTPFNPEAMTDEERKAIHEEQCLQNAPHYSYAGECHIFLRLRNVSNHTVSIRAITFIKSVITDRNATCSMLFTPQGDTASAPLRLACNLDKNTPHMQKYTEDVPPQLVGEENYFAFGSVELKPDDIQNFKLTAYAHERAYNCELKMRYEIKGETRFEDILDEENSFDLYPLESIPQERRYWRTYFAQPPSIMLEDGRCESSTTW